MTPKRSLNRVNVSAGSDSAAEAPKRTDAKASAGSSELVNARVERRYAEEQGGLLGGDNAGHEGWCGRPGGLENADRAYR